MSRVITDQTIDSKPSSKRPIIKSAKLEDVCYDIRGPILKAADKLEAEGNNVLKLNIGNPAPWGFNAPEEILRDVVRNIPILKATATPRAYFPPAKRYAILPTSADQGCGC